VLSTGTASLRVEPATVSELCAEAASSGNIYAALAIIVTGTDPAPVAWAWRRGSAVPWALRPAVAAAAVAMLLALVLWFGIELVLGAGQIGLAERVAGGAQAVWPLAVVLSCRRPVAAAEGRRAQATRAT
jgi:hypothetical protein